MPRYHALDTSISLSIWDPHVRPGLAIKELLQHDTSPSGINYKFSKLNTSSMPLSKLKNAEKSGPANGYIVDDLKEDYFEGHEGVGFLGLATPFYLVKAGRELFVSEEDETDNSSGAFKENVVTKPSTPVTNASGAISKSSQLFDPATTFSSLESDFVVGEGSLAAPRRPVQKSVTNKAILSNKDSELRVAIRNGAVVKPLTSLKPLAVTVDLSRKSFMSSIITNQRQELCITIYYNGELTHSRILRANTYSSPAGPVNDAKRQFYSGRRIDGSIEVPWIVQPCSSNRNSQAPKTSANGLGFRERWNQINQMLRMEAEEWGHYGEFRSPMGEYLEELSKQPVPASAPRFKNGDEAGIIDVVITLGKTVGGAVAGLREPRRKLHEDRCGLAGQWIIVPKELKPEHKAKIVAEFNGETAERNRSLRVNNASTLRGRKVSGKRTVHRTSGSIVSNHKLPVPIVVPAQNQDGSSEQFSSFNFDNQEEVVNAGARVRIDSRKLARRASLPISSSSLLGHHMAISQPLTVPMIPFQEDLKKPKSVAQNRYKGAEADADSEPPLKRRRLDMELVSLEVDLKQSKSFPPRSRRATSSPAIPRSESNRVQQSAPCSQGGKSCFNHDALFDFPRRLYQARQSGLLSDNLRTFKCSAKAMLAMSESQFEEKTSPKVANEGDNATTLSNKDQISVSELSALEITNNLPQIPTSPMTDLHGRNQATSFGFDGTSNEPMLPSRQRSSRNSAPLPSLLYESENEDGLATAASSVNPQHSGQGIAGAVKKVTRIIFTTKNKKLFSVVVDRERFESLRIPANSPKTQHVPAQDTKNAAEGRANSAWIQTNKYVTKNHPSVKRKLAKAAAASARQNTSSEAIAKSQASPAKQEVTKKRRRSDSIAKSPNTTTTEVSVGGELSVPSISEITSGIASVGQKIFFAPQAVAVETQAADGVTEVSPTSTNKKRNSPQDGISINEPITQSSLLAKVDELWKTREIRKRESVSPREMKELLEPHKPATEIDTSFDMSINEGSKKIRMGETSHTTSVPQNCGLNAGTAEADISDRSTDIAAARSTARIAKPKSDDMLKEPMLPNLLVTKQSITESQFEKSTATRLVGQPSESSAENKLDDTKKMSQLNSEFAKPIFDAVNETCKDVIGIEEVQQQDSSQLSDLDPLAISIDLCNEVIPLGRKSRSYSVDAEGKKIPSPRNDSLPGPVRTPLSEIRPIPSTPEQMQSTTPSLMRRSSPSQVMSKDPTISTVQRRNVPRAVLSQRGKSARVPAKISVSDAFNLSTPSRATTSLASTGKPASQAKSKRKDADMSSSESGWQPTSLCNNSVLGYATVEAWPGVSMDPKSKNVCRTIKCEREGVFRASGVLMGVRFVVGLL